MRLSDNHRKSEMGVIKGCAASDGGRSPVERILASLHGVHRRYLLYHLQKEGVSDLETAARWVAAWDQDCAPAEVPTELRDRIEIELYHTHLPKLTDLKIVDYDERTGAIRLRDPPDNLAEFLELTRKEDDID